MTGINQPATSRALEINNKRPKRRSASELPAFCTVLLDLGLISGWFSESIGVFVLEAGDKSWRIERHLGDHADFQLPLGGKTSSHFPAVNKGRRNPCGMPQMRRFVKIAPISMAIV